MARRNACPPRSLTLCLALLVLLSLVLPACARNQTDSPEYRMQLVTEMKDFERQLGFHETRNFRQYNAQAQAYDYYFYAPKTDLPYSMGDPLLGLGTGKSENVTLDRGQYDFFFYAIPAIASVGTDVTKSLMDSPLWRFIQVVFHEDWHEQVNPPLSLGEPSAEIIGYAAAIQFTARKFGENSDVCRTLRDRFAQKIRESKVYTDYYGRLSELYAAYHAGTLAEKQTLQQKDDLIGAMNDALRDIYGARQDQLNNAFIAFQMTYLRHLPLMYRVLQATRNDVKQTAAIFKAMPGQDRNPQNIDQIKGIEGEAVDYFRQSLVRLGAPAASGGPKAVWALFRNGEDMYSWKGKHSDVRSMGSTANANVG